MLQFLYQNLVFGSQRIQNQSEGLAWAEHEFEQLVELPRECQRDQTLPWRFLEVAVEESMVQLTRTELLRKCSAGARVEAT